MRGVRPGGKIFIVCKTRRCGGPSHHVSSLRNGEFKTTSHDHPPLPWANQQGNSIMRTSAAPTTPVSLLDARITTSTDDTDAGRRDKGPRQQWIDVSFTAAPVALSYITFHNYYCAAITISHTSMRAEDDPQAQQHMKGRAPTWQVVVPKLVLMAAAHCEDDAQQYHELTSAHFAPEFDSRRVTRLRICCLQPSPTWREYALRQLRFYTIEQPVMPSMQPPPALAPADRELATAMVDHLVALGHISHQIRQTLASARESTAGRGGAAGTKATSARRGADHELAPYVVGEWADELRLGQYESINAPTRSSSISNSKPQPPPATRGVAEGVSLSTLQSVTKSAERWVHR